MFGYYQFFGGCGVNNGVCVSIPFNRVNFPEREPAVYRKAIRVRFPTLITFPFIMYLPVEFTEGVKHFNFIS